MNSCSEPQLHVHVVIDVFRAFTTACYVLERSPTSYKLTTESSVISRLALEVIHPLTIGKAEKDAHYVYTIPNSPTRLKEVAVKNRDVLHRTAAGAKGVLLAKDADIVLAASFVNAEATARYIRRLNHPHVTYIPMGHEGTTSSLEDEVCALAIKAIVNGGKFDISPFKTQLREGSGHYFFSEDQSQYPKKDFERCLKMNRFNFAIRAILKDDYAILTRCDQPA